MNPFNLPGYIYSFFLCAGFIGVLWGVPPSVAESIPADVRDADHQKAVYEVYAGGLHAVQAHLDMAVGPSGGRYDIMLEAGTRGFLGKLVPWSGSFQSQGWVLEDGFYRPEVHKSAATWREETETKEYKYSKDQKFKGLYVTEHNQSTVKKDVDDALTHGTTDILAATLEVMHQIAGGHPCAGSSDVFDGKRRFRMIFTPQGEENLKPSRYNVYEGPASVCTVEVSPVSGEWHEKPRGWMSIQEQGRSRGMMPTVWVASLSPEGPAVPVKIRVKTAYGTLFMHLSEYKNGH